MKLNINFTDQQKGILYILFGSILLLYTLGIFQKGFSLLIILGSLALIVYGMVISGYWATIETLIRKKTKK